MTELKVSRVSVVFVILRACKFDFDVVGFKRFTGHCEMKVQ